MYEFTLVSLPFKRLWLNLDYHESASIHSLLFLFLQNKDGSYTGFIKVQLKLIRPVSVPANKKAPSIQDTRKSSSRSQAVKRRTSFYLPKDTVKHLHIISRTCASEVIEALLKKFMVVDNPRKFALFERTEKDDQGTTPHFVVSLPILLFQTLYVYSRILNSHCLVVSSK